MSSLSVEQLLKIKRDAAVRRDQAIAEIKRADDQLREIAVAAKNAAAHGS